MAFPYVVPAYEVLLVLKWSLEQPRFCPIDTCMCTHRFILGIHVYLHECVHVS